MGTNLIINILVTHKFKQVIKHFLSILINLLSSPCGVGLRVWSITTPIYPVGVVRANRGNKLSGQQHYEEKDSFKHNLDQLV